MLNITINLNKLRNLEFLQNVQVSANEVTTGELTITENGTFNVTTYKSAKITVSAKNTDTLGTKKINNNGEADVIGYSKVEVNVSGKSFNVIYLGVRYLNQEDTTFVYYYPSPASAPTRKYVGHGRNPDLSFPPYTAEYVVVSWNYAQNLPQFTTRVPCYVNGVYRAANYTTTIPYLSEIPYIIVPV